eukprot:CAMPEP_0206508150 /NCGR_PEP_ID=MMETSP0324_2-20121206/58117_1 /ASSEMBLY_ACC=CAM_ASM_000836 /TAXON_ID=2866 /ORGANISM="Crypthecodinium cohnii, Strain Seligo" /LENGTH=108 /DNA_ID=CAMNT_0053998871 /DNA_START=32 /DNA_END=355 /DNA_ORIENTATION=-
MGEGNLVATATEHGDGDRRIQEGAGHSSESVDLNSQDETDSDGCCSARCNCHAHSKDQEESSHEFCHETLAQKGFASLFTVGNHDVLDLGAHFALLAAHAATASGVLL